MGDDRKIYEQIRNYASGNKDYIDGNWSCSCEYIYSPMNEKNEGLNKMVNSIQEIMMYLRPPKSNNLLYGKGSKEEPKFEIDQVKLPKEGGVLTYYKGVPHPAEGFPIIDTVYRIDDAKRYIGGMMSGFREMFSHNKFKTILFFLVFRKQCNQLAIGLIKSIWRQLKIHQIYPIRMCRVAREAWRVFDTFDYGNQGDPNRNANIIMIRDLVTLILEFDDAYRFRLQNVFCELDHTAFEKNPYRELSRLAQLGESREATHRIKGLWRVAGIGFRFMRFHPARKYIIKFFDRLDIQKIKMTEADTYYARLKPNYKWE